jgi:hypothetical protein
MTGDSFLRYCQSYSDASLPEKGSMRTCHVTSVGSLCMYVWVSALTVDGYSSYVIASSRPNNPNFGQPNASSKRVATFV